MNKYDGGKYQKKFYKHANKKIEKVRNYRKEVSRKASIANKRLRRLEEKGIKTPAYEKWENDGGEYFSIRGKSYNEVQSELARIEQYLESATSTVSGAKEVVKNMMTNIGWEKTKIKDAFKDFETMQKETKNFFELASKIEQYYRTVEDSASSIGYEKIWEAINKYVEENQKSLNVATDEVESLSKDIVNAMKEWDDKKTFKGVADGIEYNAWFQLPDK